MAREFTTVGVVGLGTMGAGIVEVFAREGLQVVGGRAHRGGPRARPGPPAPLHRPGGTPGQADRGRPGRPGRPGPVHHLDGGPRRRRPGDRGGAGAARPQAGDLRRAGQDLRPGRPSWPPTPRRCRSPRSRSPPPGRRQVVGMHFFNPAPVMKLVEVVRTVVTEQEVVEDVEALAARLGKTPVVIGDRAGFIANALLFGYLNHAVSMYDAHYATREDIDAAMRLGCGLPDGPAGAARPDRPRHGVRDPGHDVPAVAGPPARAGAAAQADGHRRAARPQDRPGLLHLRGAGLPEGGGRRASRRPPRRPMPPPGRCGRSAWSAPARWRPASSRCSPRPGTTCSS